MADTGMVAGDFNGDGKPDLVMFYCGNGIGNGSATSFLGNGDGTFTASATSVALDECPTSSNIPGSVAVTDLNGDGKLDVAFAGIRWFPEGSDRAPWERRWNLYGGIYRNGAGAGP